MSEAYRSWAMKGGVTLTPKEADTAVGNPTFTQTAHGFTVGTVVRRSSATAHARAQANTVAGIGIGLALVVYVPDANTFSILRTNANHTLKLTAHGLGTFGTRIYLSHATPGKLTTSATVDGEPPPGFRVYLGYVIDADHIHWEPGWVRD